MTRKLEWSKKVVIGTQNSRYQQNMAYFDGLDFAGDKLVDLASKAMPEGALKPKNHVSNILSILLSCQLRYLQTLNSISCENNSTIIFPVPVDVLSSMMQVQRVRGVLVAEQLNTQGAHKSNLTRFTKYLTLI